MNNGQLVLAKPAAARKCAFLAMAQEWASAGDDRYREAIGNFEDYLRRLDDMAHGRNLRPGIVPETHFWLVRDGAEIIGCSRLRHRLTPALDKVGGHIGYDVCPSERGKGYGTRLLALTLEKARQMGMKRVLVTCDADNTASAKIIQSNGGKLAGQHLIRPRAKWHRRYWIEI